MIKTLNTIRKDLEKQADPEYKQGAENYFKEPVQLIGVRSAPLNKLIAAHWKRIKTWEKQAILALCAELLGSGVFEQGSIACKFAARMGDRLEQRDFDTLERWVTTHISNWAHCDDLCTHAVGDMVEKYPDLVDRLDTWINSPNRWMRRGACVALVFPTKRGIFLNKAFAFADRLMTDQDDLVQKGYGWMLKSASITFPDEVYEFILERRLTMPRTALRYAIEKLPQNKRREAMKK